MPSYTEEQKRRAVEMVEECGGCGNAHDAQAGIPHAPKLYQWLNQRDASHERRPGRPWSHYNPALKARAVAFTRSGMAGHGRQGRRRDAGGTVRRGGLQDSSKG